MKRIFLTGFFLLCGWGLFAQPFASEMAAFRRADSLSFPAPGPILFAGSSSFTIWKDVQDYFPGYYILNRGFGGSSLPDLIRYADEVILQYRPGQLVIYCGENDLAASDTVKPALVLERFRTLFRMVRERYPRLPVVYISMKPSPARWQLREAMQASNALIRSFLKTQRRTRYVDVWPVMLLADGKPDPSLFLEDLLHMNARGYARWQERLKPYLKKIKTKR